MTSKVYLFPKPAPKEREPNKGPACLINWNLVTDVLPALEGGVYLTFTSNRRLWINKDIKEIAKLVEVLWQR